MGSDPSGDWASDTGDPTFAPLGQQLGQDLVAAKIGRAGNNLFFVIGVTNLPSNGGVPEVTRYLWELNVDGRLIQLDGKWSNYSRGACDPTAGTCPPPRDPGMQPFFVRACTTYAGDVSCRELDVVQAIFDSQAATITIQVPMSLIGAKAGTQIALGENTSTGYSGLNAMASAFYSQDPTRDNLIPRKIYTVPR